MSKHNCLHLIAMIGVLLIFVGCSPGDDDECPFGTHAKPAWRGGAGCACPPLRGVRDGATKGW